MRSADVPSAPEVPRSHGNFATATEYLIEVAQHLFAARNMRALNEIVRTAARKLTGADGAALILRDGDHCYCADEDAIAPLWKGARFSMQDSVSGWVITHREAVAVEDVRADARIPAETFSSTFVRSLAEVPIGAAKPTGTIAAYWARPHKPSREEVRLLKGLAGATAAVLDNMRHYGQLEKRVKERTAQLEAANNEIRQLSLTDELTGLYNRRGFALLATQQLRAARRSNSSVWLLFADVDQLKPVNDRLGHKAGDRLLCAAARALRDSFRELDVVARIGGDEFAVFGMTDQAEERVEKRLQARIHRYNAHCEAGLDLSLSTGLVRCDARLQISLDKLLDQADAAMYATKRSRQRGALAHIAS